MFSEEVPLERLLMARGVSDGRASMSAESSAEARLLVDGMAYRAVTRQ
jgi:hypothetical protein